MRIIGGKLKGRTINAPGNLPARPTTDFAKTGLFNILNNYTDFEGIKVLDLFGGTGNISLEFASRGSKVMYVEKDYRSTSFVKSEAAKLKLENLKVMKSDVYVFLKSCIEKFDIIFADPPYDTDDISKVHGIVFEKQLLNENGLLVIEHGERQHMDDKPFFIEERKYGNVRFSFFSLQRS